MNAKWRRRMDSNYFGAFLITMMFVCLIASVVLWSIVLSS